MIVYSAIFNNYDTPTPAFKTPLIEAFLLFTDNPKIHAPGWHVINVPKMFPSSVYDSRYWKLHPPSGSSIWLDGQISLSSELLIIDSLKALEKNDIALWRHPWRDCLYDEAQECFKFGYGQSVIDQSTFYFENHKFPKNYGLWETGVLARRMTDSMFKMCEDWWSHILKFSYRDQISLPLVLNQNNIVPYDFPDLMRDGKRVHLGLHSKERQKI